MNQKLKLILISLLLMPILSFAGLLGPSNYEECMSDGKIGRSPQELGLLKNACLNKFPDLKKTYKGQNANLTCRDDQDASIHNVSIKSNKVFIDTLDKDFLITLRSNDKLIFQDNIYDKTTNDSATLYGEINPKDGFGVLKIVYKDSKKESLSYLWKCYEK